MALQKVCKFYPDGSDLFNGSTCETSHWIMTELYAGRQRDGHPDPLTALLQSVNEWMNEWGKWANGPIRVGIQKCLWPRPPNRQIEESHDLSREINRLSISTERLSYGKLATRISWQSFSLQLQNTVSARPVKSDMALRAVMCKRRGAGGRFGD